MPSTALTTELKRLERKPHTLPRRLESKTKFWSLSSTLLMKSSASPKTSVMKAVSFSMSEMSTFSSSLSMAVWI